jgi:hypothetical protein
MKVLISFCLQVLLLKLVDVFPRNLILAVCTLLNRRGSVRGKSKRPALGPIQPPVRSVPGRPSAGVKLLGVKLTTLFQLVQTSTPLYVLLRGFN